MKRALLVALAECLFVSVVGAATRYPVTGVILSLDATHRTFVASISEIPGYMKAMAMPFTVREMKALDGLKPGTFVDFTLVVEKDRSYAENVRTHPYENLAQEPMLVSRLEMLARLDKSNPLPPPVAIGAPVPDFTLTDQTGQRVSLAKFAGKVVAVTFIYTTCPLPDYCFRMSSNFDRLQKRFAAKMGRDLVLLSISFDPIHDTPEVLAKYGSTFKADANSWHFLTGPSDEVREVCHRFGLNFWPDEALMTHSLHTLVIDREGKLAANFEGNQFSAQQLGDFVETTLSRGR
jgi:protein SCO1